MAKGSKLASQTRMNFIDFSKEQTIRKPMKKVKKTQGAQKSEIAEVSTKETPKESSEKASEKSPTKLEVKLAPKISVLGKDLSSKFFKRGNQNVFPTKRGGRNGQGKP